MLPRGQWLAWVPSEPCKSYQELTLKPLHTVLSCPITKLSFWTSLFWFLDLFSHTMKRHRMRKLAVIIITEVFIKCKILSVDYSKRTHTHTHKHSPTHKSIRTIQSLIYIRWGEGEVGCGGRGHHNFIAQTTHLRHLLRCPWFLSGQS